MVACETTDTELRELQNEGMISAHWSFIRDTIVPKPGVGEVVMTKAWVERGLSLPCSEFFLSVLNTYGLQPHNICPNSYLLLSNFVTLCEGHLGIRPDIKLWQFFFRVKKETKDKAMLNCGSMTFMLRPGRMYPPHDSHESVRYWNAGWFYEKNVSVPEIHDGLPKFNNEPPEELASWSFIPPLSLTPILEKAARRISWLVHDGLTGTQLTLSWFTRRIQPLRYNARLICAYTGADDQLRATRHDLPADSLKRRFKTLVKVGRGQPIPELIKDIYTNDQCPPLATLAEENLRTILRVPVSGDTAEEVPEDEEEEEEPRKVAPRPAKRPRAKASGSKPEPRRGLRQEAQGHQAPSARFKEGGAGAFENAFNSRQTLTPHPRRPVSFRVWRINLPLLPPPEIIPVSSEKVGGEDPKAKDPAQEEAQDQGEAEVTSSEKAGAGAATSSFFRRTGDPADLTSTPKAYATKFFKQLTEPEKWELEQDLLNAMLNNAWGKPDAGTSEIQDFKKGVGEFLDKLVCKQKAHLPPWLRPPPSWKTCAPPTKPELKLKEAEQRRSMPRSAGGEKLRAYREKGEFLLKRNADSETIKRQQKELNGLRKYMETAEHHWDLLAENILEPLGYPEKRRNKFPRDDVLLSLMDLDRVSSGVPPTADVEKLLDAVSGYDTRIARKIRHEEFYDKVVLPADEPLEDELQKERDAEARPAESGSQYTWTSSKDAPEEEEPKTSAATSDEDEESDEDVSSPAEGAKGKNPEATASPSKAE
ncbi:hypothetical protein QYE76_063437 [Lolium multiflorum]|uniref:Transposase (putative) gypsy type domain-containing protein n=1 Tax=Lolium multiflorum TaxID=4521 RepID=A0AAD8W9B2_LOLMU|nr:hypothetical protein QYE76_063437 [Lolium multiflorum]